MFCGPACGCPPVRFRYPNPTKLNTYPLVSSHFSHTHSIHTFLCVYERKHRVEHSNLYVVFSDNFCPHCTYLRCTSSQKITVVQSIIFPRNLILRSFYDGEQENHQRQGTSSQGHSGKTDITRVFLGGCEMNWALCFSLDWARTTLKLTAQAILVISG